MAVVDRVDDVNQPGAAGVEDGGGRTRRRGRGADDKVDEDVDEVRLMKPAQ